MISFQNARQFQALTTQFIQQFESCSLVNSDGALLASQDQRKDLLTTTRLVAFQIVKKYLNPKPNDLFVMNDPENGGYSLAKLIFVAAIDTNLFVIWDENCDLIDFKIPPTPLYEKNKKNEFVWKALVENNNSATELAAFIEAQKHKIDSLYQQNTLVKYLSTPKNQQMWLKASQEIFELQFSNKAHGNAECLFKTSSQEIIKLKLSIEEKQNIRLITLDFTNTSSATVYHTASHVIESALIQQIIRFYQIEGYLSQAVLDKLKIILPPKSIVSKAHPTGEYNSEIQSICSQMCLHNLNQLNAQTRRSSLSTQFELAPEISIFLKFKKTTVEIHLDNKNSFLAGFENIIENKLIDLVKMNRNDNQLQMNFKFINDEIENIFIKSQLGNQTNEREISVNNLPLNTRKQPLKKDDSISLKWSFAH